MGAPPGLAAVDAGVAGVAGVNAAAAAQGMLARRWPEDWYTRYDRPVARILPPRPERAVVATGPYAQAYPVRWPQLVGQPLPPVAGPASVMGASAAQD